MRFLIRLWRLSVLNHVSARSLLRQTSHTVLLDHLKRIESRISTVCFLMLFAYLLQTLFFFNQFFDLCHATFCWFCILFSAMLISEERLLLNTRGRLDSIWRITHIIEVLQATSHLFCRFVYSVRKRLLFKGFLGIRNQTGWRLLNF